MVTLMKGKRGCLQLEEEEMGNGKLSYARRITQMLPVRFLKKEQQQNGVI